MLTRLRARVPFALSMQAEMRERLAKDKNATYTYSMDYVSQTVSLVDEFRLKEDQEVKIDMDGHDQRFS